MFDSEDTKDQHPPATGQISGQIFRICQEKKSPWDIPPVVNVYIVIVWWLMVIMVNSDIMMIKIGIYPAW